MLFMKFTLTTFVIATVLHAVCLFDNAAAARRRLCSNIGTCMPLLLAVPFRDIANMSYYYTGTLMSLSQVSEKDWGSQMSALYKLCNTWQEFDDCMGGDWVDCIDWEQAASMLDDMGSLVSTITNQTSTDDSNSDFPEEDDQGSYISNSGWTVADTKRSLRVGSLMCRDAKSIVPYMSCMRDLLLMNETLINVTIRYWQTTRMKCFVPDLSCSRIEKMATMFGHWLYHGCQQSSQALVDVSRDIFQVLTFTDFGNCSTLFKDKSAKDLFEAPYPKETEFSFGGDISRCNTSVIELASERMYMRTVVKYFQALNVTKEEFYHQMTCKMLMLDQLQCDQLAVQNSITPTPSAVVVEITAPPATTAAATTTNATASELPTNSTSYNG